MRDALPFPLPGRHPVTRVRGQEVATLRAAAGERTQPMRGFDPQYRDIVDYIVRITEEIWSDRSVGRIYDTYAADCVIHTSMGTSRGVEGVIASTAQSLHAQPDGVTKHLNVAWSGDEDDFYTAHLGFARSTNIGPTAYGAGTGRRYGIHFAADCVSRDNLIHTEWLARDNLSLLRQLGFDPHETAQRLAAARGPIEVLPAAQPVAVSGVDIESFDGFWLHHFGEIWNDKRIDHVGFHYSEEALVHWTGGRAVRGRRAIQDQLLSLFASVPDARVSIEHKSWAEEDDGVIVAIRWQLTGTTVANGGLGPVSPGKTITLIGMSHFRFEGRMIVEEWTVFDELAALVQAYGA